MIKKLDWCNKKTIPQRPGQQKANRRRTHEQVAITTTKLLVISGVLIVCLIPVSLQHTHRAVCLMSCLADEKVNPKVDFII